MADRLTGAGLFMLASLSPILLAKLASFPKGIPKSPNNGDLFEALHLDRSTIGISKEEEALAEVARRAAWAAGKIMIDGHGTIDLSSEVESKIGTRDIVTKVDKASQDIIKSTILSYFPSHKFLGEEDVPPGREASEHAINQLKNEQHLWIVDPVDGTTNYAHGMPLAGVIIAYASYGVVKMGFIYDPFRHESFVAWKGKGAYLNGRRLRCCGASSLNESVVCTGSPPSFEAVNACLRGMNLLSTQVRSMRVIGSACIHLIWVACGRITAYYEPDLNAWDLVAGALIVNEAGGRVTDVWGKDVELTTRSTVASNGKIHDVLLRKLQEAKMWM